LVPVLASRGTEIAFGKKIGSLEKPVAFSLAFNQAQLLTDSRFQKFWWKAHRFPPPPPSAGSALTLCVCGGACVVVRVFGAVDAVD
jgi:hypothetical protein